MTHADTFTSVGTLLNLTGTQADPAAVTDSSLDVGSLRAWGMAFLERWSSSSALAARYYCLLRQSEEQLKSKKDNSGTENSCNVAIGGRTPHEPYDALPAFVDLSDTFQWLPDTDALDMNAWGLDPHCRNTDFPGSGSGS